jgi:hypothetical protein
MILMTDTGRLALDVDECWTTPRWRGDGWRHGRDALDGYDDDRVLSEELADDLVNELAGRAVGSRRRRDADRPWRPGLLAGAGVDGPGRTRSRGRRSRAHLAVVPG